MARREYARIGTDMPDEQTVRACTVEELFLYDHALYLRPEMSRCGVVPYRPAVWAELATNATETKCRRWLHGLEKRGMVVVDAKYSEVLVRTFVRHDQLLAQPNVVANMVADFRVIHSPKIRAAFLTELRRIWDLPDLPDSQRGGWQLAMGHYPQPKTERSQAWPAHLEPGTLDRLRKSIGPGLATAMAEHIKEGSAAPFTEPVPEPFTQTPYVCAQTRVIAESTYSEHLDRAPAPSTEHREPSPEGSAGPHHPGGDDTSSKLLDEHTAAISRPLPAATIAALRTHITQALTDTGGDVDLVAAGLTRLRQRGGKPGLLAHLIGDLQTERAADDPTADPDVQAWIREQEAGQ